MEKHIKIYNEIIEGTPKIDTSCHFKQYITANNFHRITSKISFEEMIWFKCNPDKQLANDVYDYAKFQLNNIEL